MSPLLVLKPQVQALAQAVAQVQLRVLEPPRVRVLVQAAVLELAQGRERVRQSELAAVLESPQSQEPAVEPEQVRELRVSRQQEPQQHRLLAAAQELLPYLPALPMKAPC